jgi:Dyp-type peroxidase family
MAEIELTDIQGLVRSGYSKLPCAAYMLLQVVDPVLARAWLGRLAITTADGKQSPSINLALTYPGLEALGLPADVLATFSGAFRDGMATERRARILGDRNEDAPDRWTWGGTNNERIDVLLMLFAEDDTALATVKQRHLSELTLSGLKEVLTLEAGRQEDTREHFGFADGISQPFIKEFEGQDKAGKAEGIPLGEFLLGHKNAYGQPSDVPTVAPGHAPGNILPEVGPEQLRGLSGAREGYRDLGHNGSYLVFRQLAQDVSAFRQFVDDQARKVIGQSTLDTRRCIAAKMVGRWPSGAPLVKHPHADPLVGKPELSTDNDFGYAESDLHGTACPVGAHVRRANPRDALVSGSTSATQAQVSADRHRLLRRGRAYGDRLPEGQPNDNAPRGLHFICLNSDIERQFEFVQQTWINNRVFGGLQGEVDPLVGDQTKVSRIMTIPDDPVRKRLSGLQRFVTVKGGAYFFLPSLRAIQYLASLG